MGGGAAAGVAARGGGGQYKSRGFILIPRSSQTKNPWQSVKSGPDVLTLYGWVGSERVKY